MISTPLWNDIISFGKPVIMLGDPGQLEPIGGDPRLMHKPDMVLDQIHRQAMNSGIIQFATDIRLGNKIKKQYKDVKFMPQVMTKELLGSDIIICGFNSTRVRANEVCRRHLGHTGLICPGEPIVILKNNYHYQLFNGQIITVKQVGESSKTCTEVICDIDGIDRPVLLLNEQFGCPTTKTSPTRRIALADYGYCLTTHKSQGSEWGKVMVIDEQCSKWDAARWRYTAITRAADELIYVGLR
jgi:exodeoxyribonuclease-5